MANHNLPTNTSAYTDVLSIIDERLDDIAKGLDPATATNMSNLPLYSVRWSSTDKKWFKQTSIGTWEQLTDIFNISISGNAGTVTNGVYTTGNQTIAGAKTFSNNIALLNGTSQMQVSLGNATAYLYGNTSKYGFNGNGTNYFEFDIATGDTTVSGNISALSDRRLKTDLIQISNALSKVLSLTGYTYTRTDTNQKQTGLIAQDVEKVLPEAVVHSEKYLSVVYGNLIGLLVEAIKELKQEVDDLKAKTK